MNNNDGPISPLSFREGEWNGNSKYMSLEIESTYAKNRGPKPSPLNPSNSSSRFGGYSTNGALYSNGSQGGLSPPSSIGRSSVGTGLYSPGEGSSGRNKDQYEQALLDHYDALKRYLSASLKDEKGNPRPNRARDKLLRLSSVQFEELSTDVFDELMRRQQGGRRPSQNGGPAPFLLPRNTFHPKRNQARQKLSTLPPPRFRDLATDVFYELERRLPKFFDEEINLNGSPVTSVLGPPSTIESPVKGIRVRRPSDASSTTYSMRSESQNSPITSMGDLPQSPSLSLSDFSRPTPKVFQSHTIVPNKSTMVEDDETGGENVEEEGNRDFLSLESGPYTSSSNSEENQNLMKDFPTYSPVPNNTPLNYEDKSAQNEKLILTKEDQIEEVNDIDNDENKFEDLRKNLERKLADAQSLNESLQIELDRVHAAHAVKEREWQTQIQELQLNQKEPLKSDSPVGAELKDQRRIAEEVRMQAQGFLKEMRMLSELSGSSYEREQQLLNTINKLEDEIRDWKNRYAKAKSQLCTLGSSLNGSSRPAGISKEIDKRKFIDANGMIRNINVTKFQISVDELLGHARTEEPTKIIESMKAVIFNVRNIVQDIDEALSSNDDLALQYKSLKSRVSLTAKNLVTATKNYATARGLSPVSLLDAAASHLTTAIISLIQIVKIQLTADINSESDENDKLVPAEKNNSPLAHDRKSESGVSPVRFQGLFNGRLSSNSLKYSPANSPRGFTSPFSSDKDSWKGRNPLSTPSDTNNFGVLSPSPLNGPSFGSKPHVIDVEDLKIQLEDHTALLVQNIQFLVSAIRSESGMTATGKVLDDISEVVQKVIISTENTMAVPGNAELRAQSDPIIKKLSENMKRLIDAGVTGRQIADEARDDDESEKAWRNWNQSLPPIAFQIARETKGLVLWIDRIQSEQTSTGGD